jgi:DNA-binding MarR family transcriptional regulator
MRYGRSLSFLLSQVGARSAQLFSERLKPLGITPREFGVLTHLAAAEGQTQQQLADALGIHRNNMVGLIDQMEDSGLVRRERGLQDRRAFNLRLTPLGRKLAAQANDLIPALDTEIGQALKVGERRQVIAQLELIAESLGLRPAVHPNVAPRPRRPVAPA